MAELILIRGLPGSGKSTLAYKLVALGYHHFEADMFHMQDGEYRWKPERTREAHKWCTDCATSTLAAGHNVVVSNTFTQRWEMAGYVEFCKQNGHRLTVIVCEGNFGNVHGVPDEALRRMKARWENFTE